MLDVRLLIGLTRHSRRDGETAAAQRIALVLRIEWVPYPRERSSAWPLGSETCRNAYYSTSAPAVIGVQRKPSPQCCAFRPWTLRYALINQG